MIFAAGLGTRLKPITDTRPKALVEVAGQPLLHHVLAKLRGAGASRVVVNVHHFAQQIVDYLHRGGNLGMDVRISDESERLLDTGGGIKKAEPLFAPDEPILIHNVDILSNVDLRQLYSRLATDDALLLVSSRKTKRYLLFDDAMRLVGWTNIDTGEVRSPHPQLDPKACRMYAFAGIHVVSHRLLSAMQPWPDKFGIMDFYLNECASHTIRGYVKDDLRLMDVGKIDTLDQAEAFASDILNGTK